MNRTPFCMITYFYWILQWNRLFSRVENCNLFKNSKFVHLIHSKMQFIWNCKFSNFDSFKTCKFENFNSIKNWNLFKTWNSSEIRNLFKTRNLFRMNHLKMYWNYSKNYLIHLKSYWINLKVIEFIFSYLIPFQ